MQHVELAGLQTGSALTWAAMEVEHRMERSEVEKVVRGLYLGMLGREPEKKYLDERVKQFESEGEQAACANILKSFLKTDEFQRKIGGSARAGEFPNSSRTHLDRLNRQYARMIPAGSMLLDVGAGFAPYRPLFDHAQYESADFEKVAKAYGETTYVCDITQRIPVEDHRFHYLLLTQVLEHINEPAKALRELYRVLKPGGTLLCTVPLFFEEHEQPYDFFRYTQFALKYLFEQAGFVIEKLDWLEGFFGTCGYMLESIYRHAPERIQSEEPGMIWANTFLSAFRPVAGGAARAFYKLDETWKITHAGFPKNYVIWARKP